MHLELLRQRKSLSQIVFVWYISIKWSYFKCYRLDFVILILDLLEIFFIQLYFIYTN